MRRPSPRRPHAGICLTLAAMAGLAFGAATELWDTAWRTAARIQGAKLMSKTHEVMTRNQELLYGLRKAIATVEACDAKGVEVGVVTVQGAEPAFTTIATPNTGGLLAAGPNLPFGARKGGR